MSSSDDKEIRRFIILDHYESPKCFIDENKKLPSSYVCSSNNSPSCIDNITAHVKLSKNKVEDVKLSGIGCAIATSSSDIMAGLVKNKTKKEAINLINNYLSMIDQKKYDSKLLGELYVFDNVSKQINRINCAKVGILAIKKAIESKD